MQTNLKFSLILFTQYLKRLTYLLSGIHYLYDKHTAVPIFPITAQLWSVKLWDSILTSNITPISKHLTEKRNASADINTGADAVVGICIYMQTAHPVHLT